MNHIDLFLVGLGAYLAVYFLIRLMRRRHRQLTASLTEQMAAGTGAERK